MKMATIATIFQKIRCWFQQKELITQEEYDELLLVKSDISFMDCSGQYDDFEERKEHYKITPYRLKVDALKLKHDRNIRFLSYPYSIEDKFEVKIKE